MNVAFFSPCLSSRCFGGVQLSGRLALEALNNLHGANVRSVCYGPDCAAACDKGCAVVCRHTRPGAAIEALKIRNRADELLFWHSDLVKLLPFLGARRARNTVFLHGIECWQKMSGLLARGLARVDLFLSNSDFTWRRFVEMNPWGAGVTHRTVALGAGAPDQLMMPPDEVPAALMIGRMAKRESYKGHEQVIRAWPRISRAIPNAELWIAGGGDGAEIFQSLAGRGECARQIRFWGTVSEEEKQALLRRSRCLLLPSRGEGFGLVYLEAMRVGRPCLAGIHDAGRELVAPHAGLAIDPDNNEGLAAAVTRLLTPGEEWRRWSANARCCYEAQFTAAHFQRRLIEALGAARA